MNWKSPNGKLKKERIRGLGYYPPREKKTIFFFRRRRGMITTPSCLFSLTFPMKSFCARLPQDIVCQINYSLGFEKPFSKAFKRNSFRRIPKVGNTSTSGVETFQLISRKSLINKWILRGEGRGFSGETILELRVCILFRRRGFFLQSP